jgi:hypothetical protein
MAYFDVFFFTLFSVEFVEERKVSISTACYQPEDTSASLQNIS